MRAREEGTPFGAGKRPSLRGGTPPPKEYIDECAAVVLSGMDDHDRIRGDGYAVPNGLEASAQLDLSVLIAAPPSRYNSDENPPPLRCNSRSKDGQSPGLRIISGPCTADGGRLPCYDGWVCRGLF